MATIRASPIPRTILSDPQAAAFVSGVAFHGYAGDPSGMSVFHQEFPKCRCTSPKARCSGSRVAWNWCERLRNWASSYNAWVTILDDKGKPNNGPFEASRTIITLDSKTRKPTEHFDFFLYGQFMKFIQRGAVRVDSSEGTRSFANVAFRNPDGRFVLIVVNADTGEKSLNLVCSGRTASVRQNGKSVATFTWSP